MLLFYPRNLPLKVCSKSGQQNVAFVVVVIVAVVVVVFVNVVVMALLVVTDPIVNICGQ